ncbi:MAG: hypothetical protein B7Y87_01815 [Sphingomonadales bacterium 32-64-22]|nr:MAG: hypothetical protein B7Y87_01815 [Sphingomonadales bacterium 32-64-22]
MFTRSKSPWLALVVMAGITTIGFIDRIVVNVLVEPVKAEFALSDSQVSLMAAAFTALNIFAGILIARRAESATRTHLIALGTVIWSAATALCAGVSSWFQLLAARMGVGLGEAIGLPSVQSVVADYFPPRRRGFAMSVLMLAPPLGALIGYVGGGAIAHHFSWRYTFLIAAIPGFVLALLVWLFVSEPRRGVHDAGGAEALGDNVPSFREVLSRLLALPSARNMIFGSTFAAMLGFGMNYFFTSLMIRRFGLGLAEAGMYSGLIASAPAMLSVLVSGWLGDKFGEKTPAAYALVPAVCLLFAAPAYYFGLRLEELGLLLAVISVATFLGFGYLGITYAALQNLMHPRMRVTGYAVLQVFYGLASAVGPIIVGTLSDTLSAELGPQRGLTMAMASTGALYVIASGFYFLAARTSARDLARVNAAV